MLEAQQSRIPITEQARLMAKVPEPLSTTSIDSSSRWEAWAKVKPEMYAICAVLGNDVIDRALGLLADPSRITRDVASHAATIPVKRPPADVFENLYFYTRDTLWNALDQESRDESKHNLWKRYRDLDRLLQSIRQRPRQRDALTAGLGTAAKIMADTLRVIPEVYTDKTGHEADMEAFLTIAQGSFSFLAQFAMLQIGDFEIQNGSLRFEGAPQGPFDSEKFDLINTKNGRVLVAIGKPSSGVLDFREPFVGCPASVKIEGDSAIKKLWDWHVSVAVPL